VHDLPAGEDHLGGGAVGGDLGDVGEEAATGLERQPAGDLAALRRGRDDHRRGRRLRHQLREHLGLGGDEELVDLAGLGDVDLLRAVLGELLADAGGDAGAAGDDRRDLTERAGGGERLQGALADGAVGRVELDEDQDLCHGDSVSFAGKPVRRASARRGSPRASPRRRPRR
jgi:hypothetical protein